MKIVQKCLFISLSLSAYHMSVRCRACMRLSDRWYQIIKQKQTRQTTDTNPKKQTLRTLATAFVNCFVISKDGFLSLVEEWRKEINLLNSMSVCHFLITYEIELKHTRAYPLTLFGMLYQAFFPHWKCFHQGNQFSMALICTV